MPAIAALYVYPVKSCRGIELRRARLTTAGLQHDREWMVVTPEGRFLTQREVPKLAVVATSLDDLNSRLQTPLPVERFRPNILLAGCEPYAEDRIGSLAVRDVRLRLVKPCARCSVTTVEQSTGTVQGDEPLRTLKTYRWDARKRGVMFGQNAIVEAGDGALLAVGDVLAPAPPLSAA